MSSSDQAHRSAARQIVICCDGTNNTLTGRLRDTHVLRLFEALQRSPSHVERVLYYDAGVGAMDELPATGVVQWLRGKLDRLWSLAYGRGIYENIGQAYAFLMTHWRPGDQIWLFGFSRGAFTVRSVSGMVNLFGILKPEHEVMLPILLNVYFAAKKRPLFQRAVHKLSVTTFGSDETRSQLPSRGDVASQIRTSFTSPEGAEAGVHFVGVWDTVEAVGIRGLTATNPASPIITDKRIWHVRHALSLDEQRAAFRPRLYLQNDFGTPSDPQSLRQRWFWGAHGDSGGGYPLEESALADRALRWMIAEANELELNCALPSTPGSDKLAHDPIFATPWWAAVGMTLRRLDPQLQAEPDSEQAPESSVPARLKPILHDPGATPPTWIWTRDERGLLPLIGSSLGVVGFAWLYGFFLAPCGTPLLDAWDAGSRLVQAQLQMATAVFGSDWAERWYAVPQTHPAWAFVAELGLMASVAYLLGRGVSRAFAHLAGRRTDRLQMPWWHWLGRALPLALAADFAENIGTSLALVVPHCIVRLLLGAVGAAAVIKWAGFLGCALLLLAGFPLTRPALRPIEEPRPRAGATGPSNL